MSMILSENGLRINRPKRIIETPDDMRKLTRECEKAVQMYVDKARHIFNLAIKYPLVDFTLKGTTAGKAWPTKNRLQFSPTLLRENADHFVSQIVGHEVAHLVAPLKFGHRIDPHGAEWSRVMYAFKLPPLRCHSYDTSNVPTQMGKRRSASPSSRFVTKLEDGSKVTQLSGCRMIEL